WSAHDCAHGCDPHAHAKAVVLGATKAALGRSDVQFQRARVFQKERVGWRTAQHRARLPVGAAARARLDPADLPGRPVRHERAELRMIRFSAVWAQQDARLPARPAAPAAELPGAVQAERLGREGQRAADETVALAPYGVVACERARSGV